MLKWALRGRATGQGTPCRLRLTAPEGPLKQQVGSVCSFPVTLAKCNPIVHRSPNRYVLVQFSPVQQEDWHSQHFNPGAQELFLGFHCHNLPPDCSRIKLNKSLAESEIQQGKNPHASNN